MIIVCGMETSATIHWSTNAVPLLHFAKCGWGGCNGQANTDRGPRRQFTFSTPFACPFNPLTPHSATQWEEECSEVNTVPLVSMLQTRSSQMLSFKMFINLLLHIGRIHLGNVLKLQMCYQMTIFVIHVYIAKKVKLWENIGCPQKPKMCRLLQEYCIKQFVMVPNSYHTFSRNNQ